MLLVDTCQAASMAHQLGASPPVVWLASSKLGQNSFSYVTDPALGVALSDRFSFHLYRYVMWQHQHQGNGQHAGGETGSGSSPSVGGVVGSLGRRLLNSDLQLGSHGHDEDAARLPLLRYFAQAPPRLRAVAPLGAGVGAGVGAGAGGVHEWEHAEAAAFWGGLPPRVADEAASEGIALPLEAGSLVLGALALVGGLGVRRLRRSEVPMS